MEFRFETNVTTYGHVAQNKIIPGAKSPTAYSRSLARSRALALLLHDYVEHYCLVPHPMAVLGRKRM
jgi:hypothetical protein